MLVVSCTRVKGPQAVHPHRTDAPKKGIGKPSTVDLTPWGLGQQPYHTMERCTNPRPPDMHPNGWQTTGPKVQTSVFNGPRPRRLPGAGCAEECSPPAAPREPRARHGNPDRLHCRGDGNTPQEEVASRPPNPGVTAPCSKTDTDGPGPPAASVLTAAAHRASPQAHSTADLPLTAGSATQPPCAHSWL